MRENEREGEDVVIELVPSFADDPEEAMTLLCH